MVSTHRECMQYRFLMTSFWWPGGVSDKEKSTDPSWRSQQDALFLRNCRGWGNSKDFTPWATATIKCKWRFDGINLWRYMAHFKCVYFLFKKIQEKCRWSFSVVRCPSVGPCSLEYSRMKIPDHYWTDPSADELVQRHRIHSGSSYRVLPATGGAIVGSPKRPGLQVCKKRC